MELLFLFGKLGRNLCDISSKLLGFSKTSLNRREQNYVSQLHSLNCQFSIDSWILIFFSESFILIFRVIDNQLDRKQRSQIHTQTAHQRLRFFLNFKNQKPQSRFHCFSNSTNSASIIQVNAPPPLILYIPFNS